MDTKNGWADSFPKQNLNWQVSEIDLKVGLLPGIPMALRGTVVTKAKLTRVRCAKTIRTIKYEVVLGRASGGRRKSILRQ